MSYDGHLYRSEVVCVCGAKFDFNVEHPPIPMIVVGFSDPSDGRDVGDTCPNCEEPLIVPADAPHDKTHRTVRAYAEVNGCKCVASDYQAPAGGARTEGEA